MACPEADSIAVRRCIAESGIGGAVAQRNPVDEFDHEIERLNEASSAASNTCGTPW
ncbi:hypothetical protein ABZ511_17080 [Nocardia gamkensis]|uniref:hypothetical protein n=1 Tax=Nocardia gamkensis TaxID=352869 RepID=UPI0033F18B9A